MKKGSCNTSIEQGVFKTAVLINQEQVLNTSHPIPLDFVIVLGQQGIILCLGESSHDTYTNGVLPAVAIVWSEEEENSALPFVRCSNNIKRCKMGQNCVNLRKLLRDYKP